MWDALVEAMRTGNGWLIVLLLFAIILTARFGHLKIKTDKILIGKSAGEQERLVMKKQSEFAHYACMGFEKEIPHFEGYNEILGRLIAEKAYDEIVSWIMINHIVDAPYYISNKQEIIWNLVVNETVDKRMRTDKFKDRVYSNVESIIKQLVAIRDGGKDL